MYTKTVYFISQISTLKMGFRAVYFITPVYFISTVYFISPPPSKRRAGRGDLKVCLFLLLCLYCISLYYGEAGEEEKFQYLP